jgi:hypothetical protein
MICARSAMPIGVTINCSHSAGTYPVALAPKANVAFRDRPAPSPRAQHRRSVRAPIRCRSRSGPPGPGNSACMTRRRVAGLGLVDPRRVPGCAADSRWLIIDCAGAPTALPVMPHSGRHSGRPIATSRRRTRTRHRSPPRTGCVLWRLTSAPTRTGPAHGGAAARGRCCGDSVRTPRTVT